MRAAEKGTIKLPAPASDLADCDLGHPHLYPAYPALVVPKLAGISKTPFLSTS